MKIAFQLAYKNLMGAGLRTWLNVGVLSFAFVVIIFYNGLIDGWNQQAKIDGIAWEYGNGHLLNDGYDPFDPFSIQDGHGTLPEETSKNLVPVLIRQATIYSEGRMISAVIKGIEAEQNIVELPTRLLEQSSADIPVVIGKRMAASANLEEGEEVLLRWRDKNGTFDATNVTVVGIFDTDVPTVDNGQIWLSIEKMWEMTGMDGHATFYIADNEYINRDMAGWEFHSQDYLLRELTEIIEMKKISGSIMYLLLLAIELLAIAMGMTRMQVVGLFTVEGSMYSLLATLVGCAYGIPLFIYIATKGIGMPVAAEDMGVALAERIFPVYGAGLIISTIILVVISATIVSFLPARKIAKMNPVDALKGKLQ